MGPIRLNRRRFLGCSAAAGWALSQGMPVEGSKPAPGRPLRLAFVGLGNRGTTLLRAALEFPDAEVVALCDSEPRHLRRAQGIAEKARKVRPEGIEHVEDVLARADVDAVVAALPCDLHAATYRDAIRAGKHLYGEKPLALTLADCDMLIDEASRAPELTVHVGFQRRSHPRYREAVELARGGELGALIEGRARWISSNGPMNGHGGWLAHRARSGDWMLEQAVHVWDIFGWVAGGPPSRAYGQGRRGVFADLQPDRDVTDHYSALLDWPDGFHASLIHSWVDPADDAFTGVSQHLVGTAGGLDLGSGSLIFRDRERPRASLHPGTLNDTRLAVRAFLDAIRSDEPLPPPVTLVEARDATLTGLMVRRAVDERRVVTQAEILSGDHGIGVEERLT